MNRFLTSKRRACVGTLAALCLAGAQNAALSQSAPASTPPDAAPVPYTMTMGDLMNTFVQPRHAKLGLAGRAGNWPLATYALAEIRETFAGIVKAKPRFAGMPVGELADAALQEPLRAVEAAIKQHDPQKFAAGYDQLTQGCNACHATLDHPYVVIKMPDASAFPNQEFNAAR
jgi:hypothetical protein